MAFIPNKIKMSGTFEDGALKKGTMLLGVDELVTFGPTSSTNWWAGIAPPANGYTAYLTKGSQGPSIYTTTDIIPATSQISGNPSINTLSKVFEYYFNESDKILTTRNFPSLYTNQLVFAFDTSTPMCWSSSVDGKDVSSTQANINIDAVFDETVAGGLPAAFLPNGDFTPQNNIQGIGMGSPIPVQTISIWMNTKPQNANNWTFMDSNPNSLRITDGSVGAGFNGAFLYKDGLSGVPFVNSNQIVQQDNSWHNYIIVLGQVNINTLSVFNSLVFDAGVSGYLGEIYIWDKALEQQELTNHWQEFRGKYGI